MEKRIAPRPVTRKGRNAHKKMTSVPTHLVEAAFAAKHARLTVAASLEPGVVEERAAEPIAKPEPRTCSNEYCWCWRSRNGHRAEEKKS